MQIMKSWKNGKNVHFIAIHVFLPSLYRQRPTFHSPVSMLKKKTRAQNRMKKYTHFHGCTEVCGNFVIHFTPFFIQEEVFVVAREKCNL